MEHKFKTESTCRICLGDEAIYPIFEDSEVYSGTIPIKSKFLVCFNEKIEDLENFPQSICNSCNMILETMCNFINTFKESQKILADRYNTDMSCMFGDALRNASDDEDDKKPLSDFFNIRPFVPSTNAKEDNKQKKGTPNNMLKKRVRPSEFSALLLGRNYKQKGEKWSVSLNNVSIKRVSIKKEIKTKTDSIKRNSKIIKKGKKMNTESRKRLSRKIKKEKEVKSVEQSIKLCDICGSTFTSKDALRLHIARHSTTYNVKCKECPRVLKSKDRLRRHMKRVHGKNKCVCPECGAVFVYQPALNSHIKNVHNKIPKNFSCDMCDKTYKSQLSLIIHRRSVHTGERPAVCSVCNSAFYHENYLKEHMRLHTGETPFKCPICDRGYTQRGNMISHVKHNHTQSQLSPEQLSKVKPSILKKMKK